MKRYYFDTEFMARNQFLQLISIGIVCEDGREYYAESSEAELIYAEKFVRDEVLPHLGPKEQRKTRQQIKDEILAFVGKEQPLFHAYFASYDWVLFCQLFGTLVELPNGWPQFCIDLMQMSYDRGCPPHPKLSDNQHHALEDARWNKKLHAHLLQYVPTCLAQVTQGLLDENRALKEKLGKIQ